MSELPTRRATKVAWVSLAVLTGINLLNYLDRFVLSSIASSLAKPEEAGGLGLSETEVGLLYSGFIVVYLVAAPVFGLLADRFKRGWILAVGVALWSVATAAGALAQGFIGLLLTRMATGVGESAYATVAPSVIGDHFPVTLRARAMGIFNSAIPIGAALGFVVGGWAVANYGWRHALLIAGAPGVLLAIAFLIQKDPKRGESDPGVVVGKPPNFARLMALALRPRYALCILGYALQTAGFGALAYWAPQYLEHTKRMTLSQATITFGIIIAATGIVGAFLGAWWGDSWRRKSPAGLLKVCAITSIVAAGCVFGLIVSETHAMVWIWVTLACLSLVASVGPINAQVITLLAPSERASGVAMCIVAIHLLGDVPSVPMVGWLAGWKGFDVALGMLPLAIGAAGAVWWLAARVESHLETASAPASQ